MTNVFRNIVANWYKLLYRQEYIVPIWRRWINFSTPHRPTPKEVSIYRHFIDTNVSRGSKFLIFGATPELRDLAVEIGAQTFLIDISWPMFRGMLLYTKVADAARETWIKSDWEDAPLQDSFFDVVVGDLSLRHVAPPKQERILAKISRLLCPNGLLISRVHTVNPKYFKIDYKEIFDEMVHFPYREKKYEAMGLLLSRLLDRSTKTQMISRKDIIDGVEEYIWNTRAPIRYRLFLYEFLVKRVYNHVEVLTSQTKEELEGLFRRFFTILDFQHDGTYPESEFYPIYLLRKKGD